jgi:hypothetical protein
MVSPRTIGAAAATALVVAAVVAAVVLANPFRPGPAAASSPPATKQITASGDAREMIARQLTELAGEARGPIRQQDLGFAVPTRMEEQLAGQRIARCVLEADAER